MLVLNGRSCEKHSVQETLLGCGSYTEGGAEVSLSDILVSDLVLCILNCIFHHGNDRMWLMVYIPVFKCDDNSMNTYQVSPVL